VPVLIVFQGGYLGELVQWSDLIAVSMLLYFQNLNLKAQKLFAVINFFC